MYPVPNLWVPACAGMTRGQRGQRHGLKKTPPRLHGGVLPCLLLPLGGRHRVRVCVQALRGDAGTKVDPDSLTDFDFVVILEDVELASDRIPGVGTLVRA